MREQAHNYEVEETTHGFRVIPRDEERKTVEFEVNDTGFWSKSNYRTPYNPCPIYDLPLYAFRRLLQHTVTALYSDWKYNDKREHHSYKVSQKIREWAMDKTSKVLNHRVLEVWKNKVNETVPLVRDLHRKLFSISCGNGYWANVQTILKENNHYFIKDILNYRAAGIYALWGDLRYDDEWMLAYSATGQRYTSLNKTLMNLPGNIYGAMLINRLPAIFLPEPATTRLRLLAYLCLFPAGENINIVKRSTDEQIKNAIKLMWLNFPNKNTGSFIKTQGIIDAFRFMNDYTGSWDNIDILGLARRSIEYHRNEETRIRLDQARWQAQQLQREEELEKIKEAKTALPKISLPSDPNVTFLDSFQAVVDEGKLMKHCIAHYAERAVKGNSYLFHVDYDNEMASVEVSPNGFVQQSYGPMDTINKASEYGRKILSKWARDLTPIRS